MYFPEQQLIAYLRVFLPDTRINSVLDDIAQAAIESDVTEAVEFFSLAHWLMDADDRRTPAMEAVVLVEEVGLSDSEVAIILDQEVVEVERAVAEAWDASGRRDEAALEEEVIVPIDAAGIEVDVPEVDDAVVDDAVVDGSVVEDFESPEADDSDGSVPSHEVRPGTVLAAEQDADDTDMEIDPTAETVLDTGESPAAGEEAAPTASDWATYDADSTIVPEQQQVDDDAVLTAVQSATSRRRGSASSVSDAVAGLVNSGSMPQGTFDPSLILGPLIAKVGPEAPPQEAASLDTTGITPDDDAPVEPADADVADTPDGPRPAGEDTDGQDPVGKTKGTAGADAVTDEIPTPVVPSEDATAENTTAEKTAGEKTAAEDATADDATAQDTAAEDATAEDMVADGGAADDLDEAQTPTTSEAEADVATPVRTGGDDLLSNLPDGQIEGDAFVADGTNAGEGEGDRPSGGQAADTTTVGPPTMAETSARRTSVFRATLGVLVLVGVAVLGFAVFSEAGQDRLAAQGFDPLYAFLIVVGFLGLGMLLLFVGGRRRSGRGIEDPDRSWSRATESAQVARASNVVVPSELDEPLVSGPAADRGRPSTPDTGRRTKTGDANS